MEEVEAVYPEEVGEGEEEEAVEVYPEEEEEVGRGRKK